MLMGECAWLNPGGDGLSIILQLGVRRYLHEKPHRKMFGQLHQERKEIK